MPRNESQLAPSADCGSHVRGIHNSTVQTAGLRKKALMELKILKGVYPLVLLSILYLCSYCA